MSLKSATCTAGCLWAAISTSLQLVPAGRLELGRILGTSPSEKSGSETRSASCSSARDDQLAVHDQVLPFGEPRIRVLYGEITLQEFNQRD